MTADLVKQARDALAGVTDGPWTLGHKEHGPFSDCDPFSPDGRNIACVSGDLENKADPEDVANARFIAAARQLVPAMADRIEADAKRIAELEALTDEMDFLRHEGWEDSVAALEEKAARADAAEARVKVLEDELKTSEGYAEELNDLNRLHWNYWREEKTRAEAAEARVKVLEVALRGIDALDPERLIDSVAPTAMRGLVLRMGTIARAALEGEK